MDISPIPKNKNLNAAAAKALGMEMAPAYKGGASIRLLAATYGRSYGAARRTLQLAGVPIRQRGGDQRSGT